MMKFTIFKRLAAGFLLILLVVTALGAYSTLKLRQLNQIIRSISSIDSETIRIAERLRDGLLTQRKFEKKYVVSKDKDFHRQFLETGISVKKDLDQMSSLMGSTEDENLMADITAFYERYFFTVQEEVGFIKSNKKYSDRAYEDTKEVLADQIIRRLEALIKTTAAAVDDKMDTSREIGSQAMRIIVILTLASIIMAILIALYNARTIHHPILLLKKETKEIARGRFEKHVVIPSPPEIGELADAFNDMCDRLKELDDMKADLISHISHEFRTPLAVIREAVSLHLDSLAAGSVERQRRLLGIVEEECERLITSVNKVLDLSRMDAGMMDYQMEAYSLSHLIDMSASKIRPIAMRKGISLEVHLADGLPHAVVDAEKIGQVLDNLLDNALKFTSNGGKVAITAVLADHNSEKRLDPRTNGFIKVAVSDTGCGIPKEDIHSIFDKFKKLHEKGTGLGLYIARRIIEAHGGDIWVESDGKTGSAFFFTVPVSLPS